MQECQQFHLVSVKRQDEVVQDLFQQMIAKSQGILMLKAPMWAGSMFFCHSWTFMTLR